MLVSRFALFDFHFVVRWDGKDHCKSSHLFSFLIILRFLSSDRDSVICLYLKIPEKFMSLIIIIIISVLLSVFYNLSPRRYPRPSLREGSDYMHFIFLLILSCTIFPVSYIAFSSGDKHFRKAQYFVFHIGWVCQISCIRERNNP